MAIDAKTVKELRDKTGLPMMKCKKALTETDGDMDQAIDLLRKEGAKAQNKRSDRENNEGIIYAAEKDGKYVLVELKCETDFVGKNQDFINFAKEMSEQVLESGNTELMDQQYKSNPSITVSEALQELTLKIGEKLTIGKVKLHEGLCGVYVHHDKKQAALVKLSGEASLISKESIQELITGLCQHIVFTSPQCKSSDELSPEIIEKETAIIREEIKDKPEQIQEKIIAPKLKKVLSELCLLDQKYIKDNKKSISDLVSEVGKEEGKELALDQFELLVIGK
ncbi:MAG: translation elongation factor Ts [Planctomycetota bacterium]|nr:MAG: translation elongation factor Ts [Planctomycetota bacterium]